MTTDIRIRFLKGAGVYAFFKGSKNLGSSNTNSLKETLKIARKQFPKAVLTVK